MNLYAKERRGAKIKIYKTKPYMEGTPWEIPPDISGELITVKQDSLLLLDAEGKDVSVAISEIKVIVVMKKSRPLFGAGIGLLGGAGSGAIVGYAIWGLGTFSLVCNLHSVERWNKTYI